MCFMLHMASTRRVERVPWNGNDRHLCVDDVGRAAEDVGAHFSLPDVAYVGSSLGCGCGFRSVSFQNGGWPGAGILESGGGEPPEDHARDHQELHDLVVSLIREGRCVELYGCWAGDEREKAEREERVPPSRLLDDEFWFRERVLYGIEPAHP